MSAPIITGLMAYGMSGRVFHAPFLSTNPGFVLKAVVERHEKTAANRYPQIISYNSTNELLADSEISLIIINTPNDTHFDYATQALHAGKNVLIEKPATITVDQARQLFDLGRKLGLKVMVFQNRRYDSDFLSVKEVIRSGALGELIEVHFRMDRYKLNIGTKRSKETRNVPGSGLTYDLGPHLLDSAISIWGRPLSYAKTTAIHRPGSQVDDYFHVHLQYPGGLNVYLTSGLLVADPGPGFVIHGTSGSFVKTRADVQEAQLISGMLPTDPAYGIEPATAEGKLTIISPDNQKTITHPPTPKGDYNKLFDCIHNTITANAPFPITEDQVICQIEMLKN